MERMLENLSKAEFISISVREPRVYKEDIWHTYMDYEICLETNSMCFRKKWSSVRRRYSEFVWLRQSLEQNALVIDLPKLPPPCSSSTCAAQSTWPTGWRVCRAFWRR
ncbi:hypothetical protein WMY93_019394 [Mugilogobius chulae]|uniref:PX domain-containing protein n=1 Tax=Mugilogobius chulae TaxID=88201 RepID=A0AAW0NR15_9GOBI